MISLALAADCRDVLPVSRPVVRWLPASPQPARENYVGKRDYRLHGLPASKLHLYGFSVHGIVFPVGGDEFHMSCRGRGKRKTPSAILALELGALNSE
ncbi:MAG: hypothetical protein L6Q55_02740 [Azonexus sp.]|nr:hypothetical protein [Azonexus sp.]MCK6411325.1 hypothetical protein [Azonexus sp.]